MEGRSKPIDEGGDQGASGSQTPRNRAGRFEPGEPRAKTKRIENRDQVMGWRTEPGDRNVVNKAENCEGEKMNRG